MLPQLSHIENYEGYNFWVLLSGKLGVSFSFQSIDADNLQEARVLDHLKIVLAELSPKIQLRISSSHRTIYKEEFGHARADVFKTLGQTEEFNIISLETRIIPDILKNLNPFSQELLGDLSKPMELLLSAVKKLSLETVGLELIPLDHDAILSNLDLPEEIIRYNEYISFKNKLCGIVRVLKMMPSPLTVKTIAHLKSILPKPFSIHFTTTRVPQAWAELSLRGQKKESLEVNDFSSISKAQEMEESLDRMTQGQDALMEVDLSILIKRPDEKTLRSDLEKVSQILKLFSQSYIENIGTYPSFLSTKLGSGQHVSFREMAEGVAFLLPIYSYSNKNSQKINSLRRLRTHRRSYQVDSFDFFANVPCGNTLICGASGRGKSVLVSMMTESIMHDPTSRIFKIDVGSSYKRECERLGGIRYELTLDQPSGLNPFSILSRTPHSNEICHILGAFVESLILQNGEVILEKSLKVDLMNELLRYSESRPENPTLDDFYQKHEIPRKKLLSQWVSGGIFENIFKSQKSISTDEQHQANNNRYKYYDFKSVSQAQDPDLVRGAVVAVMTEYNSEVYLSGRVGPKIFLICDETKFFFKECSPFFHLTAANARKYGHALILINQESSSFYTRGVDGVYSDGLYVNSSHHFLFTTDGDENLYRQRHKGINDDEWNMIKSLEKKPPLFSEVFHKDDTGSRVYRLIPTGAEYWRWTSEKDDWDRIVKLKTEFSLTEEEVLACLSISKDKNF